MSAVARLRRETAAAHKRLESTRFARAIVEGTIERAHYVHYLRAIAFVLDNLNAMIARHGTARDRAACARLPRWRERLGADLEFLGGNEAPINASAQEAALVFADNIRCHVDEGGAYLLGVAYVLIGSHRGNRAIAGQVAAALELDAGRGVEYLAATAGEGDEPWREFTRFLGRELGSDEAVAQAAGGAREAFELFEAILDGVYDETQAQVHVRALNPEAGNHPIIQDAGLIEVAMDSAERAMQRFPYLGFRYGVRGRRFASSDSAWLLTLVEAPDAAADRQIDWLNRLLVDRGIPSICLEVQLDVLADALGPSGGERLRRLARFVAGHREDAASIVSGADELARPVPELGASAAVLLSCARLDQAAELGDCADNIRAWASDEPRLSAKSKAAIVDFLQG